MHKAAPYIVSSLIAALATIPNVYFAIVAPFDYWPWMVILAGLAGIFLLFSPVNWVVRVVAVGGFINCFFSSAPYLSFTCYVSLVACCWFYFLCSRLKDWSFVLKTIQALIFLNIILLVMQAANKDVLTNFGWDEPRLFGTIGQHMQMGSMSVILAAFGIQKNAFNSFFPIFASVVCHSTWTFFCGALGFFLFLVKSLPRWSLIFLACSLIIFGAVSHKMRKFDNFSEIGRWGVWKRTVSLANKKAETGWGLGMFKHLYHPLSNMPEKTIPWRTAHNDYLQILFEAGYPAFYLTLGTTVFLAWKLWVLGLTRELAGLGMIAGDALVHFPSRMIQAVLIIIAFLAYCEFRIKEVQYGAK